jgi:RsmE family RNA methyltransferase
MATLEVLLILVMACAPLGCIQGYLRFYSYSGHRSWRSVVVTHTKTISSSFFTTGATSSSFHRNYHDPHRDAFKRSFSVIRDDNLDITVRTPEEIARLPRIFVGQVQLKPVPVSNLRDLAKAKTSKTKALQVPPLSQNTLVELSPDQAHYVKTVLRLFKKYTTDRTKARPQIKVFADGEEWVADLISLDPFELESEKAKRRGPPPEKLVALCRQHLRSWTKEHRRNPSMHCWLSVAPPKNKDRLRWLIEKTTEMDCTGYILMDTEYSEGSEEYQVKKFPKMQAYCVEAAEQCERLNLPPFVSVIRETEPNTNPTPEELLQELTNVPNVTKFNEFLHVFSEQPNSGVVLLVCRERSNTMSVWSALEMIYARNRKEDDESKNSDDETTTAKTKAVVFLIGPEGGWSPNEQRLLNVLERDFPDLVYNISLGRTILRTETAALTAMAAFAVHRDFVHIGDGEKQVDTRENIT